MSFVWGDANVAFLKTRFKAMSANHCYRGMEYSESHAEIGTWAPLIMEGRPANEPVAATRIITGTDVDYGALTHLLFGHLAKQPGVNVTYRRRVRNLRRTGGKGWLIEVEDVSTRSVEEIAAKFVFIGAGGGALELLQKSGIPEGHGYGGFPVSGIWLRCDEQKVVERHDAKVYGKAALGSPPMSVPHLDRRVIGGKTSLLFGPYAGFTTRFLKHGSLTDLFRAIEPSNILPMLAVARDNVDLSEYLVGQVLQSKRHQFGVLQKFYATADRDDWLLAVAGERVEVIKPDKDHEGALEFGTELIGSEDRSLVALMGASPGASTAAFIALNVLKKCFPDRLTDSAWLPKLKEIIPTFGVNLIEDAAACDHIRAETAPVLKIANL
jgi:malate dehydrogenase (quinone)